MAFEHPEWLAESSENVATERAVGDFWKRERIFEKSIKQAKDRPAFVFYEGPPTANGMPHPGHAITRAVKDVFPRYRTMTGMSVPRKAGWDTHGLPVEIEVEKELGLSSKDDIEKYGVVPFIRKCLGSVWKYTSEWEEFTERIGFWVDLGEAYVTYKKEYVESVWWAISELWKKKLIYQGAKIMPWCPRCGTGLSSHEVGWGYKTVDSPSVTVKFRVTKMPDGSAPARPTYLLAWTTTPWTLLSNAALAVKPDAEYVYHESVETNGETWIVARRRATEVIRLGANTEPLVDGEPDPKPAAAVHGVVRGTALAGMEYEPLFPPPAEALDNKRAHYVLTADFVTLDEGTGIVHIAPAFGADDQLVGRANDLPMICRVDPQGHIHADAEDTAAFAGRFVKDADKDITRNLKERGLLVDSGTLRHEYPHCWRCDSPLLYYPRTGWFIRTTDFRDRMLELNAGITWYPEHIREGRFGNFLRDNVDWALSRERYWGTPLPIWKCTSCSYTEAASSLDDLGAKDGAKGLDEFARSREADPELDPNLAVHKPWIDEATYDCPRCSGLMRRVPEVIDCWFDSGAMPFAQWGYPAKGEAEFRAAFPAQFISEAIDQTRGWFYSMLAISTMLFDRAPYENCVVLGLICDEKGAKMSKSKGNYVAPGAIIEAQGADALRWYFLSANQPWTSVRFTERSVRMAGKDFLVKLRNVYRFFLIYARIDGFDPAATGEVTEARPSSWGDLHGRRPVAERAELDRWILSELAGTVRTVRASLDAYDAFGAAQVLSRFVESLSNWYLRRNRSRYWGAGKGAEMPADKLDAYWTLYEALVTTALLVAPFTPFAAEELYQTLVRSAWPDSAPESVHLCEYPADDEFPTDDELARGMALAREVATLGRAARAQANLKVRMPLAEATVVAPDPAAAGLIEGLVEVVADELNVKRVTVAREDPPEVSFRVKPNFKTLGPRLGKRVKELAGALARADGKLVRAALRDGGSYTCELGGESIELSADDLDVRATAAEGYAAAAGPNVLVLLNVEVTEELTQEGLAREIVSRIQARRKALDLPYEARIETCVEGSANVKAALAAHEEYVKRETLSERLLDSPPEGAEVETGVIDGDEVRIAMRLVR